MMTLGGNRKLKEYLTSYGIAIHGPDMVWKYRTKAGCYYRDMVHLMHLFKIRNMVDGIEPTSRPSLEEGMLEEIPKQTTNA